MTEAICGLNVEIQSLEARHRFFGRSQLHTDFVRRYVTIQLNRGVDAELPYPQPAQLGEMPSDA